MRATTEHRRTPAWRMAPGACAVLIAAIAAAVAAAGCGGGESESSPPVPAGQTGGCQVTITGAVSASFSSPGGYDAVATDYWLSDEETRTLLGIVADDPEDPHPTDRETEIEQGMLHDPRFITLGIFCKSPGGAVMLLPGESSAYFNVPFRPDTYEISPGATVSDVIPGNFAAIVNLVQNGQAVRYVVFEPGELAISVFNRSRVAGGFHFNASAGDAKISVKGQFDFRKPVPPQAPPAGR